MEVIEGQVQQMTRLADDLLEVSPVRPGKMHLRREVDDLRDIGLAEAILNKPSSTPRIKAKITSEGARYVQR
jgi:K+-sensing histidine kinase KdpD